MSRPDEGCCYNEWTGLVLPTRLNPAFRELLGRIKARSEQFVP
jgi:hypothetical protein